jgi:hypothetical protein
LEPFALIDALPDQHHLKTIQAIFEPECFFSIDKNHF